ncbi:MAG: Wzz/FepE/Etk N-terminal domain-containing protein [Bacteroidetes bacterium]|nr:Wzz/FepE/Etk N-terminal domain-containing protein [Bacteroidota bacterium]
MAEKFTEEKDFDSSNFILFLIVWRKPVLIISILAFVLSVIFSSPWFITPLYKSTVVMYPTSVSSISKALLSETYGGKEDILAFGEDEQTEQMLQILNSNRIRDRIIQKFDLMKHYNIDPNSRFKLTKLYDQYESNITYRRTEYNAVKIIVLDKDPQLAANIANDISNLLDSVKIDMQKQRAIKGFKIVKAEYLQRMDEIQQMEDSLTELRKKGVHDYETQAEMINQQLAIEIAKNNTSGIRALERKLDTLAKYGGPYVSLRDALEHEKKQFSVLKTKYEEAKVDAEEELPQKFVVSSAYSAEKKSYPLRWLIVLVSTVSAFLVTLLVIITIDNVTKGKLFDSKKKSLSYNLNFWPNFQTLFLPGNVKTNIKETNKAGENKSRVADEKKTKTYNEEKTRIIKEETTGSTNGKNTEITEKKENQTTNITFDMENILNNINLLRIVFKWKWHIIILCVLAGLLAAIFSGPFFIKPRFKSVAVVYPSNIAPYSDESETEQMIQWFNSKDIKDSVIKKFNLAKHYRIDSSYKYFYSTMMYKYGKNVKINKTMYESVEIEVMDSDPRMAYDIVNAILDFYNLKIRKIHRDKYNEVVTIAKQMLDMTKNELDTVERNLYDLRTRYQIVDYANQTREVARGYLRTVDGTDAAKNINFTEVAKLKKAIEEKGGVFIYNNTRMYDLLRLYSIFQEEYDRAYYNATKEFTYTNIVSPPVIADKKSYPVRWLMVFYSVTVTLLLSLIIIVIVENRHYYQVKTSDTRASAPPGNQA